MGTSLPFSVLESESLQEKYGDYSECMQRIGSAVKDYQALSGICLAGGGEKGAQRHVEVNKKVLVRDRLRGILDQGKDVFELSLIAGMGMDYGDVPCAGTVAVIGSIRGVRCLVLANDATVKGGTSYPITVTKSLRAQRVAAENGLPCVYVVDSGGAFLPLQSDIFPDANHGGRSFANQALMSAVGIPQVSLVAGMCTAGGAYTPTMADEHVMVHKIANVYLGGPPLVKAALGETISGEKLGGATLHCTESGVADHFALTEAESFSILRDIVSSLNVEPDREESVENPESPLVDTKELDYFGGRDEALTRIDLLQLLARLLDGSKFQEFKTKFGTGLLCGFGFIHGKMTAFISNCGPVEQSEGQKGAQFVQICESRDVPIVFLQNSGKMQSSTESFAALKERGKMAQCVANARVPKITLNITGAAGDDNFFLCGPSFGPRFYLMWPRAVLRKTAVVVESEGKNPDENPSKKKKKLSQFEFDPHSAHYAASRLTSDGIVLPSETRQTLDFLLQVSMKNYVSNQTINTVRKAAGLPLLHNYGAMRF